MNTIVIEFAVIEMTVEGPALPEVAAESSVEQVRRLTEAPLVVPRHLHAARGS